MFSHSKSYYVRVPPKRPRPAHLTKPAVPVPAPPPLPLPTSDDSDTGSLYSCSNRSGSGSTASSRPLLDLKEYFDSQLSDDELGFDFGKIFSNSGNSSINSKGESGRVQESVWTSSSESAKSQNAGQKEKGEGSTNLAAIFERAFGPEAKATSFQSDTDSDVDSLLSNLSVTRKDEGGETLEEQPVPEADEQSGDKCRESGTSTELIAQPDPYEFESSESDTDDSATTVCSPRSTVSWMTNSPMRRLLRKYPKPVAAVPPMRRPMTVSFRQCTSKPSTVERKLKIANSKAKKKDQGFGSTETKRLVQRVLHDYFKVKKKKKHYKKENETLKSKLARHVLEFEDPSDAGFNPDIFKDNISEKLSKSLKSRHTRDVLAVVKKQSQIINSQISSMSQRPLTKPCGCLLFDDEIVSSKASNSKMNNSSFQSIQRTSESQLSSEITQGGNQTQAHQDTQNTQMTAYTQSQENTQTTAQTLSQHTISPLHESSLLFSQNNPCPFDLLSFTPRFWHSFN